MTPEDIAKVERKIRTACVRIQKAGGQIVPGDFGTKPSLSQAKCCPVRALGPCRARRRRLDYLGLAARAIGIPHDQAGLLWSVVFGFDDGYRGLRYEFNNEAAPPLRALGETLGTELRETGRIKSYKEAHP
jgi:hypothetical protein